MKFSIFVLCACALALIDAQQRQKTNANPVACLRELRTCSRADKADQAQCLRQMNTCTNSPILQRIFQCQTTHPRLQPPPCLLAGYTQCAFEKGAVLKRKCITEYLEGIMDAERKEKFVACTHAALHCYAEKKGCKTPLLGCLRAIHKSPKGHEDAWKCIEKSRGTTDATAQHTNYVKCLGKKNKLFGRPKLVYICEACKAGEAPMDNDKLCDQKDTKQICQQLENYARHGLRLRRPQQGRPNHMGQRTLTQLGGGYPRHQQGGGQPNQGLPNSFVHRPQGTGQGTQHTGQGNQYTGQGNHQQQG